MSSLIPEVEMSLDELYDVVVLFESSRFELSELSSAVLDCLSV